MSASLVGSEMCIRDRTSHLPVFLPDAAESNSIGEIRSDRASAERGNSVSYTHLTLPTICSV
eukprot:6795546-Alexandrium_andersonii.AAC.1